MSILSKIPKTFEKHAHIAKKIDLTWDSPEAVAYIEKLLISDRAELREGFDFEVWQELDQLLSESQFQRVTDEVSQSQNNNDAFKRD